MKTLLLTLVFIFGCSYTGSGSPPPYPTLEVHNLSGASVRVFLGYGSGEYKVGSAWPGKSCFNLTQAPDGGSIFFGIKHLAQDVVWAPQSVLLSINHGWRLVIHQPNEAVFDLVRLQPMEKC